MLPAEGEKKHCEMLKKKTSQERLKTALNLSNLVNKIMLDGIRSQHPRLSPLGIMKQAALRAQK